MARNYLQGLFKPKNPEKYVGDVTKICFRSSWEKKFFIWADKNPDVVNWMSEELVIPYVSPIDNQIHRYFPDMAIRVKQRDGSLVNYLIEIKPDIQTKPPKRGKRSTDKYIQDLSTYAVNQAKWKQAEAYCKKKGMHFMILTERHLY